MAQRDGEPAVLGRRRTFDHPAGGDGVVEAQVVGEPGRLLDDVGVGRRRDRDLAGPVLGHRQVHRHVDPARRQHDERHHGEQGPQHGGQDGG